MNLLQSASKVVFLLLALTACVAFFIGKLDPKDFMNLCLMSFTFYFSYKGSDAVATESQPYAGK
ncbi:MAG: hypothetical protein WC223_13200 [Bacteroidales bacterium]|jgi:hypothetical protein